jgi:hypothetical protein
VDATPPATSRLARVASRAPSDADDDASGARPERVAAGAWRARSDAARRGATEAARADVDASVVMSHDGRLARGNLACDSSRRVMQCALALSLARAA